IAGGEPAGSATTAREELRIAGKVRDERRLIDRRCGRATEQEKVGPPEPSWLVHAARRFLADGPYVRAGIWSLPHSRLTDRGAVAKDSCEVEGCMGSTMEADGLTPRSGTNVSSLERPLRAK